MLQVRNLTRRYGSFVAVNNTSFTIQQGEIVGLLGHNGAGKTTIMKMLSGYLEPDSGQILVDDVDISEAAKVLQKNLGYLPENLPVYPEMVVADYLDYAAELKGLSGETKINEIRRAVQATDIAEKLLEPIYTLSRGFKQRVGVAQAILGRPKLLILDEPTNGLDPTQTEQMRKLILELAKEATVILSTHIMQEVDAICDRVLIINRGELVVDARLEELRKSNRLSFACSLDRSQVEALLASIDGVSVSDLTLVDSENGLHFFSLALTDAQDHRQLCAALAKAIVGAGADLYQINSEKRDLETLFKEVNKGSSSGVAKSAGGLSHAA